MKKETNFRIKERFIAIGIMMLVQVSVLILLANKIIGGIVFFSIIGTSSLIMFMYNQYCFCKVNNEIWEKP